MQPLICKEAILRFRSEQEGYCDKVEIRDAIHDGDIQAHGGYCGREEQHSKRPGDRVAKADGCRR